MKLMVQGQRGSRQRGSSFVEAAFVLLPLFALLFAIIDFSMAIFMRSTFQNAVREGVRYAVTYQTMSGMCHDASIKEVVKSGALGFLSSPANEALIHVRYYLPTDLSTEVTGPGSNAPGNIVEIAVENYNWGWMAPLLRSRNPLILSTYAADRMEGLPGGTSPPCR